MDIKNYDLEGAIALSDGVDIKKLAVTDTERFVEVVKYLADNGLLDKVTEHLQRRGYHQLMLSVEVFRELQQFLRAGLLNNTITKTTEANSVIMCGKGNASC